MQTIKAFHLLIFVALIAGCSSIYGVQYDYNQETDFSQYTSYDWMPVPVSSSINDLVVARVKKAVDAQLGAKGLTRTAQNPDFLIANHLGKEEKVEIDSWGYSYYSPRLAYRRGFWGGPDDPSVYYYEEGTLILDFVDAGSKKLFWRGSAKAHVQNVDTPEKRQKLINEAVKKILEKYPPPSD